MENILVLDTSVGSLNKGDEIIMKCIRHHLKEITDQGFMLTLPTHVSPFHWYQVARKSHRVNIYKNAKYKFVGGTNLLTMNMLTHFPQWNINYFNYGPLAGSILVGVGAGKGSSMNFYTRKMYSKVLSKDYVHSVRDERTKNHIESLGLKAINTGCASLWLLTPEFCEQIPVQKAKAVVFTLTHHSKDMKKDQFLINTLQASYEEIFFWIQDASDLNYFNQFDNRENIKIVQPTLEDFEEILRTKDIDYIGTRLHGGIYAMRFQKRTIIISIDERADGMSETYNINALPRTDIEKLPEMVNSEIITDVKVDFTKVNEWKSQFF